MHLYIVLPYNRYACPQTSYYLPQIQSEGRPWEYFYSVTHHGHFVQRWLPIENDHIIVY